MMLDKFTELQEVVRLAKVRDIDDEERISRISKVADLLNHLFVETEISYSQKYLDDLEVIHGRQKQVLLKQIGELQEKQSVIRLRVTQLRSRFDPEELVKLYQLIEG